MPCPKSLFVGRGEGRIGQTSAHLGDRFVEIRPCAGLRCCVCAATRVSPRYRLVRTLPVGRVQEFQCRCRLRWCQRSNPSEVDVHPSMSGPAVATSEAPSSVTVAPSAAAASSSTSSSFSRIPTASARSTPPADERVREFDDDPTLGSITPPGADFDASRVEREPRRTFSPPDLGESVFRGRGSRRTSSTRSRHSPAEEDGRITEYQRQELDYFERVKQQRYEEAKKAEAEFLRWVDQRNQAENDKNRAEEERNQTISDINVLRVEKDNAVAEKQREERDLARIKADAAVEVRRLNQARADLDKVLAAQKQPPTGFQHAHSRSIVDPSARPPMPPLTNQTQPPPNASVVVSIATPLNLGGVGTVRGLDSRGNGGRQPQRDWRCSGAGSGAADDCGTAVSARPWDSESVQVGCEQRRWKRCVFDKQAPTRWPASDLDTGWFRFEWDYSASSDDLPCWDGFCCELKCGSDSRWRQNKHGWAERSGTAAGVGSESN